MKKLASLIVLLVAIQFAHVLDFVMMLPLGPRLQAELHLTPARFATLVSAYTFSAGIVGFVGAFFIDRFDRKQALLVLFAGFIGGTAWCGLAGGFSGLMIARILAGAFGGIVGSLVTAIVADVVPPQDRGKALGFVMAAFPIASVLGIPLAIYITQHLGWKAPFLLLAGLSVGIWGLVWAFAPALRGHLSRHERRDAPTEIVSRVLQSRGQLLGLGLMCTQVFGHFTLVPLLSTYMMRNVGLQEGQLSLIYIVGGLLQFGTNPATGWLADRFGRAQMFLVICFTSTVPIYLISHLPPIPVWQVLIVTGMFFVFSGSRFIPAMALINDQVDARHRGSYMGFISCVQQVSSGLASYVAGWLVNEGATKLSPIGGYERVGYWCMAFTALSAIISWYLRRPGVAQHAVPVG